MTEHLFHKYSVLYRNTCQAITLWNGPSRTSTPLRTPERPQPFTRLRKRKGSRSHLPCVVEGSGLQPCHLAPFAQEEAPA